MSEAARSVNVDCLPSPNKSSTTSTPFAGQCRPEYCRRPPPAERRADGDGKLGQVRDHGQQNQAAQGFTQAKSSREHIRCVGQINAGNLDGHRHRKVSKSSG
jgi:hypothetical protein